MTLECHPKSLISATIESAYGTCYRFPKPKSNLSLVSCPVSEIRYYASLFTLKATIFYIDSPIPVKFRCVPIGI